MAKQQSVVLPFTSAAIPYREKFYTTTWTPGSSATDISPLGQYIKTYGYLRALKLCVTTSSAGTAGSGAYGAHSLYGLFSQVQVTQPNGEELYGGPTFTGFFAGLAAEHSGWKNANNPTTLPSWSASVTSPQMVLPITFELNGQLGVGSLPNMDASAPWKVQVVADTSTNLYSTAPTTAPTAQIDYFIDCWSVPQARNPLNQSIAQEIAPPLLGTLNKWTVQNYTVTGGSQNNILLSRKGNSIRNLVFVLRNSSAAEIAVSNYPDPFSFRWDGTLIRANDKPLLVIDDEYATRGGNAGSTPVTAHTGVIALQMGDISGLDNSGVSTGTVLDGFGMGKQWGTVQSSTIEIDGTFGATAASLLVLTNDVQFVNLAGNPFALNYPGGVYLQAPAQVSARP